VIRYEHDEAQKKIKHLSIDSFKGLRTESQQSQSAGANKLMSVNQSSDVRLLRTNVDLQEGHINVVDDKNTALSGRIMEGKTFC